MYKKLFLSVAILFLLTGMSFAADVPVTFTFQTQGESDLANWIITEYDEGMVATGTTFNGPLTGGQVDVSTDQNLIYPDGAETTKCYTARAGDGSNNVSEHSEPVCKRVDELPPGACINLDVVDQ